MKYKYDCDNDELEEVEGLFEDGFPHPDIAAKMAAIDLYL